jgi:hypothetical protein
VEDCKFKHVEGSFVRKADGQEKFTMPKKCVKKDGTGLTLDQVRKFADQCSRDKRGGKELSAADYNNWGCSLVWSDQPGAVEKFEAGLRMDGVSEETREILRDNLERLKYVPKAYHEAAAEEEELE